MAEPIHSPLCSKGYLSQCAHPTLFQTLVGLCVWTHTCSCCVATWQGQVSPGSPPSRSACGYNYLLLTAGGKTHPQCVRDPGASECGKGSAGVLPSPLPFSSVEAPASAPTSPGLGLEACATPAGKQPLFQPALVRGFISNRKVNDRLGFSILIFKTAV